MITGIEVIWGIKLFLMSWVLSSWAVGTTEFMTPAKNENVYLRFLVSIFQYVMSCPKCFSFWLILFVTQNFFWAAGISFLIMLVDKLTQNIKTKL